jgi:predicted acyltransferase
VPDRNKTLYLVAGGLALLAVGWLWNLQFPVIKKLWTSSFVLVAGGYSCLLLALFYQIIDVWKFQAWAQPFIWIGMNAITIYMAVNLVEFDKLAKLFVGGDLNTYFGRYGQLVITVMVSVLVFGFCRFLYRRKIFLRV